jgi:transcriptional regulator NrdR family protein
MSKGTRQAGTKHDYGLQCRHCGCKHFRVVYTRPYHGGRIMRCRECRLCGVRMTTWEKAGR